MKMEAASITPLPLDFGRCYIPPSCPSLPHSRSVLRSSIKFPHPKSYNVMYIQTMDHSKSKFPLNVSLRSFYQCKAGWCDEYPRSNPHLGPLPSRSTHPLPLRSASPTGMRTRAAEPPIGANVWTFRFSKRNDFVEDVINGVSLDALFQAQP